METSKKKKRTIFLIIASILVVTSGTLIGLIAGQKFFTLDFSKVNVEIDENDKELYTKYETLKKGQASQQKYLDEFRPYQLVRLALMNFKQSTYAQITNTGNIVAAGIANQKVYSKYIKTENSYFSESLSVGLMKIGFRFYQENDEIKIYKAKELKNETSAEWSDNVIETHSVDSFKETWGKTMAIPFIYTLNKLTVDTSKESSEIVENNIIVNLSLDPNLSTVNYAKQIKKTSNLSGLPTFSSIDLRITMDSNLMILKNEINEKYSVPYYGIPASTQGTILENYTYIENINIPQLDEDVEYR